MNFDIPQPMNNPIEQIYLASIQISYAVWDQIVIVDTVEYVEWCKRQHFWVWPQFDRHLESPQAVTLNFRSFNDAVVWKLRWMPDV